MLLRFRSRHDQGGNPREKRPEPVQTNRTTSVKVVAIPADLSKAEEAERHWALAHSSRINDALVNNVGLGRSGTFSDPEGWMQECTLLYVNVILATVLMKLAIVETVKRGNGRVLGQFS